MHNAYLYVYKTNQHTDSYQNAVFLCFGTDKNLKYVLISYFWIINISS